MEDVPAVQVIGPWHPNIAEHLRKKGIRSLLLNPHKGFSCEDYGFLSELNHLELLQLGQPKSAGYSGSMPLSGLKNLRCLSATFALPEAVDFSSISGLQSCSLKWTPKSNGVFQAKELKKLYLTSLTMKKADQIAELMAL